MIVEYIECPIGLKDTSKICLKLVAQTEWLELSDDSEQPLKIPTVGDVYSIAFVTPSPNESKWAGDLRLSQLGQNSTLIEFVANSKRFYPFLAILKKGLEETTGGNGAEEAEQLPQAAIINQKGGFFVTTNQEKKGIWSRSIIVPTELPEPDFDPNTPAKVMMGQPVDIFEGSLETFREQILFKGSPSTFCRWVQERSEEDFWVDKDWAASKRKVVYFRESGYIPYNILLRDDSGGGGRRPSNDNCDPRYGKIIPISAPGEQAWLKVEALDTRWPQLESAWEWFLSEMQKAGWIEGKPEVPQNDEALNQARNDRKVGVNIRDDAPWEQIPDYRWDRHALELWWKDHEYKEIAGKLGEAVTAKTVMNRLSQLRKQYGEDIVPTDKQLKKIGKKFRTSGY